MKKVLFINNYFSGGGAEKVFSESIKAIKLKNPIIQIYTASCDKHVPDELKTHIEEHLVLSDSKQNPFSYIFNFSNFYKIYKFTMKHKPDVIHIHSFYGSISPSIVLGIRLYKRQNSKVKILQTLHDYSIVCPNSSLYNYHSNEPCEKCINKGVKYKIILDRCYHGNFLISLLKFLRTQLAIKVLKHADIIDTFIAPSNFLKEKHIAEGIQEEKIVLIRNPISGILNTIDYKTENKEKSIIYVGRLSSEKGIDILVKGFNMAKESGIIDNGWKLYIVGSGPEEEKLKLLSKREDIKFLGWLKHDEVIHLIRKSSLLVLPSICYENAPNVVIEGILNCTKVLLTNHGGMKEFSLMFPEMIHTFEYNQDKNKMMINLAEALSKVLNKKYDPDCKKVFHILNDFTFSNYADKILNGYEKS